jgi:CRP-like cAMP-binding protein
MGVGRAGSIRQAQIQAEDALRRIHLSDKSRAFCLLEDNRGFEISPSNGEVSRSTVGSALSSAAQKTGVRVQTLYAIYTFTLERGTDEFTAGELSEYLKISVRSTNRLLEKLEAARYVAVTGQSYDNERGRPSRLMKFYPNGHMQ